MKLIKSFKFWTESEKEKRLVFNEAEPSGPGGEIEKPKIVPKEIKAKAEAKKVKSVEERKELTEEIEKIDRSKKYVFVKSVNLKGMYWRRGRAKANSKEARKFQAEAYRKHPLLKEKGIKLRPYVLKRSYGLKSVAVKGDEARVLRKIKGRKGKLYYVVEYNHNGEPEGNVSYRVVIPVSSFSKLLRKTQEVKPKLYKSARDIRKPKHERKIKRKNARLLRRALRKARRKQKAREKQRENKTAVKRSKLEAIRKKFRLKSKKE